MPSQVLVCWVYKWKRVILKKSADKYLIIKPTFSTSALAIFKHFSERFWSNKFQILSPEFTWLGTRKTEDSQHENIFLSHSPFLKGTWRLISALLYVLTGLLYLSLCGHSGLSYSQLIICHLLEFWWEDLASYYWVHRIGTWLGIAHLKQTNY